MAEKTAHRCSTRLGRVIWRKLYLHAVVTGFAQRINLFLLLAASQHVVKLLVGWINRELFSSLLA